MVVACGKFPSEYDNHKQFNKLASERRKAWINRLKRADLTESKIKNGRICSKHFISASTPYDTPLTEPSTSFGQTTTSRRGLLHGMGIFKTSQLTPKAKKDVSTSHLLQKKGPCFKQEKL
ncbi:hypothetical protein NQ317_006479 [Molorchus minor]|uniref:THAP-type domain-containing protein n=1 Tax=Molorchus minor TaxID=1323400 RepID=A0ABQ9J5R8_9CUCU|nr:hypothetical protein NQ317_006479 [Molorchus minor]